MRAVDEKRIGALTKNRTKMHFSNAYNLLVMNSTEVQNPRRKLYAYCIERC